MNGKQYVHSYSEREAERLVDQATTLAGILHSGTEYPPRSMVLEVGCGVGAQTQILARKSPQAKFMSIDISAESLKIGRERITSEGLANVTFLRGDIFDMPFREESFDHVFACFVLEHLPSPVEALLHMRKVLKRGGSITSIEGDHGSTFFHPDSPCARSTIQCLIDIQRRLGGNALLGRQLHPLLTEAGYRDVQVSPRTVYVDSSRLDLVRGFTRNTFIAMVEGVREEAIRTGLIRGKEWEQGIRDLYRTTDPGGTFVYSFFSSQGLK